MKQPVTFLVWTDNSPGVLIRLTTLFTRRKINVESLTVCATEQEGISRFTVTISTDPIVAATIGRQIERMIEVRRVFVFSDPDIVHREVALVRAYLDHDHESALRERFSACKIVERGARGTLVEFTGTEGEISALLSHLDPHGITEFVRSGRIAVTLAGEYDNDLTRSLHDLRPGASEGPEV